MSYTLLHIVVRVHEEILQSTPGQRLSDEVLAVSVKARVGAKLAPSKKQIKGARDFLQRLGYPLVYSESEHRWFYDWSRVEEVPDCLDDLVERMQQMPKSKLACLFILRHGLDALVGTPFWSEAAKVLRQQLEERHWRELDHLRGVFSVRQESVPVRSPEVFEALAEAVYQRSQLEVDYAAEEGAEVQCGLWDPLHLCQDQGHWHVIVLVRSTNTLETFPVSRVRRLESTGKNCAHVSQIELRGYIRQSFGSVFVREKALETP
jgi:hypothetical protein